MKIILCRNHSIGSYLLRLVMWSRYSHTAIRDGDYVYDSTMLQGGVEVHPYARWKEHYPVTDEREVEVKDLGAARAWLKDQVGKPYDWTALLGLLSRRDWQQDDAWFCSELAETFRSLFSAKKFRADAWLITPHHQDIVA